MKVEEVTSIEYSKIFTRPLFPYNSADFNLLNSYKVESLKFLLFSKENQKIGLIAGIKENTLLCPFSAPFSCFSFQDESVRTNYIFDSVTVLDDYCISNKIRNIRFTLPPSVYNEHLISKQIFSFCRNKYSAIVNDNHIFYTKDYSKYENGTIRKGVRHNIRAAINGGLKFREATGINEFKLVHDIIRINKENKERIIGLTFEQILQMKSIVDIDYFLVTLKEQPVASAIIYNYTPAIAQIIYWGDLPGYNSYYPMNFLAMNIFRIYNERNFEVIDLGNSSTNSEPNYGLSNFKEVIGCTATTKFTFTKTL